MMTREEFRFIEKYCAEQKMSYKKSLRELKLSEYTFHKARCQYAAEDISSRQGEFIQLSPDGKMSNRNMVNRQDNTNWRNHVSEYLVMSTGDIPYKSETLYCLC